MTSMRLYVGFFIVWKGKYIDVRVIFKTIIQNKHKVLQT